MVQIARLHEVVLVTHAHFQSHLEPALERAGLKIEIHYFRPSSVGRAIEKELNSRLYYTWWQWRARKLVRGIISSRKVDLIHHITWGTVRFPSFLGNLGVPFVMGPLGGGDTAPLHFYEDLPLRSRLFEAARSLSLAWVRVDPLAKLGPRSAALVLCRTRQTLEIFPDSIRAKAAIVADVGCPPINLASRRNRSHAGGTSAVQMLFAGRLLGLKGLSMAVGAVAGLRAAGFDVSLDIAGDGPLRPFLRRKIAGLGLGAHVRLLGSLPRDQLLHRYGEADLFLFPSLHDSGGTVVLEALSRGLPVICLDLGGPQNFIDESCGVVVKTAGRSRSEVERALAEAIAAILKKPGELKRLSKGALEQASAKSWENLVTDAYRLIHKKMGWNEYMIGGTDVSGRSPPAPGSQAGPAKPESVSSASRCPL